MTDGYSRADATSAGNREPAAITAVDVQSRTAIAMLRSKYTVNVDCSFAVGDAIVTPAIGEQWYVERIDMVWRLASRIPFNDATLNIEPEMGQVSVGSASGPLELNGTEVRANGVFRLQGGTLLRDTGTQLQRSPDGGVTWIPISGGGGGGGVDSTDDVAEGVTNKYYTAARVAADAPVKSVAGKTGVVTLVKGDVGLGNVDNTTDNAKPISSATASALSLKADLVGGIVPTTQLPVPAVAEYANLAAFLAPGHAGTLYIAADTGNLYRWDSVAANFELIVSATGGGAADTDELPEGPTNLYYTNARVQALFGSTAGTITQGNDARLSDTRTPTNNTVTTAKIVDDAVTTAKILDANVTTSKIADANITTPKIADANVTMAKLASDVQAALIASPYDISYPQTLGQRAVGLGQNTIGVKLTRAVTFNQVVYRCGTADNSGSLTVEIRKNGLQVSGTSVTIASGSQVTGQSVSGSWAFAAGDILTVYITAVGGSPVGIGLVADLRGDA